MYGAHIGKFGFCGFLLGASLTMATPALASPGCDAANAGTFNQSVAANTNLFTQTASVFFLEGETIFATVTGIPLGVDVDLLPGPESILFVNGANASSSRLITTSGFRIIDITLAGGPSGPAILTFSCTEAPAGSPSSATDQSSTATNATTTSTIVENRAVGNIIDSVSQANPEEERLTDDQYDEQRNLRIANDRKRANALYAERDALIERGRPLDEDIKHFEENPEGFREKEGDALANMFGAEASDLEDGQQTWLERAKAEARRISTRINQIDNIIDNEELPLREHLLTPREGFELDDGEAILFAPLSPFDRALARYRGFRIADTSEGPGPNVTPLSLTRTLDAKTVGWIRAVYTDYKQNDASQQDGDNILIAAGAHRDFTSNLRLGAFVTATWGDVESPVNNLSIDTSGYSVGAYSRYTAGALTFSASTRIGITDNDIAVSGTTGNYDTRLASFTLGVSGKEQLSDNIWMQPAISLTNTWVNREDYVNSAGTAIGGNTTWSGNLSAGPTISTSLTPPSGFTRLEPALGLLATYTYSNRDSQSGSVLATDDDYLSLSLSPQLSMELENGMSVDLFGSYFGIGADLDGWSLGGTISVPFN